MPYLEDQVSEHRLASDEPGRADPACNTTGVKALCGVFGVPFDSNPNERQFTYLMFCAFAAVVRRSLAFFVRRRRPATTTPTSQTRVRLARLTSATRGAGERLDQGRQARRNIYHRQHRRRHPVRARHRSWNNKAPPPLQPAVYGRRPTAPAAHPAEHVQRRAPTYPRPCPRAHASFVAGS